MILYHGSNVIVQKPDTLHSRKNVDFGQGFYATNIFEQSKNWCQKFIRRGEYAYISKYKFDENKANSFNWLKFDSYNEEWLDFFLLAGR